MALTAHAISGDRDRCLAVGMDDYLSKPFTREALLAILNRWLPAPARLPVAGQNLRDRGAECLAGIPGDQQRCRFL